MHARQTAHRIAGHKVQHADDAFAQGAFGFGARCAGAAVLGVPADGQMLYETDAFGQLDLLLLGEIVDGPADRRRRIVDGLESGNRYSLWSCASNWYGGHAYRIQWHLAGELLDHRFAGRLIGTAQQ